MSRLARAVLMTAGLAAALGASPVGASAADSGSSAPSDVTVIRTQYGVPHITASSFRGVGYGYGRSIATDNILAV